MTGLLILVLLVATAVALLWALRIRGAMLQLAAAVLLLGGAGYALQGRPSLDGSPAAKRAEAEVIPLTGARRAFFGEFTGAERWLIISESYARRGATDKAVGVLKSATREHPSDPALWIGLGNALVDHAGVITPAAELSYKRAAELAPGHPAAPFFYGLALARSGDRQSALALWHGVLAEAPADASWRPLVEDALAALAGSPPPQR